MRDSGGHYGAVSGSHAHPEERNHIERIYTRPVAALALHFLKLNALLP
jgi:hypothetical protein